MQKVFSLGLHKTGSSSLQWFLGQNQVALARAGLLFPPVLPKGIARLMAELVGVPDDSNIAYDQSMMGHNPLAYRLLDEGCPDFVFPDILKPTPSGFMMLEQMEQMVKGLDPRALILCSEDFARMSLLAPQSVTRLRRRFGADDVRLLCTVRRPDEAIEAWQSQALKGPTDVQRLGDAGVEDYLRSVHFDYEAALTPWLQAYPDATLDLRTYQETMAMGGSVAHFRQHSGLDLPDDLEPVTDRNISLHPALFEIVRLAKTKLTGAEAYLLRGWLERSTARLDLADKRQIEMLGAANRARLVEAFDGIHRFLSQAVGRSAFFDDIDQIGVAKEISNIDATSAALPSVVAAARMSGLSQDTKAFLEGLLTGGILPASA